MKTRELITGPSTALAFALALNPASANGSTDQFTAPIACEVAGDYQSRIGENLDRSNDYPHLQAYAELDPAGEFRASMIQNFLKEKFGVEDYSIEEIESLVQKIEANFEDKNIRENLALSPLALQTFLLDAELHQDDPEYLRNAACSFLKSVGVEATAFPEFTNWYGADNWKNWLIVVLAIAAFTGWRFLSQIRVY